MNKLKLSISTCPNDIFMFYDMIKSDDYNFTFGDIKELNDGIKNGEADISKLSFLTYFKNMKKYKLLNSGTALGKNCGPLVIGKRDIKDFKGLKIAVPGKNTTAFLLFTHFFGKDFEVVETLFSDIMELVKRGKVDAGVIIHESRFTYHKYGLKKLYDLGELWENNTNLPLPLGAIAVKRSIDENIVKMFEKNLSNSIKYNLENLEKVDFDFLKRYSDEMENDVLLKHIKLYVNKYSIDLGDEGKEAIKILYNTAVKSGFCDSLDPYLFDE
ncbi:MAG: 1,4-dihydroxy-6-naphthoate synthase [Candidatus Cloacimonadota bacterium]|nr:MAG: 1,4-dihydroxy-6-naphthoate synthase [Candidatus Cloacimonadota bacterium]PIE80181.1 MAG: 1,4-dihydroxy-6-naphthoate synthase [Candidatus Delongbacteria bacterium]